jgi:ribosomal 30S subunit maturation factor RimM
LERHEHAGTDTASSNWTDELEPASELGSYDPLRFGFIEIGVVVGPHGVRGECKLRLSTDFVRERLPTEPVQRYLKLTYRVYPRPVWVQNGRPASQPNQWIIRIRGVEDRDAAVRLRGATLYVHEREQRPLSLDANEYTIREWIGRPVILRERLEALRMQEDVCWTRASLLQQCIGKVMGVIFREDRGGAHDSLELLLFQGQRWLDVPFTDTMISEWNALEVLTPSVSEQEPPLMLAVLDPPPGLLALAHVRKQTKPPRIRGYLPPCRGHTFSDYRQEATEETMRVWSQDCAN